MRYILAAALILITTTGFAQTEGVVELLRHDIQAEKMAIMTASLPMTEAEGNAFWPIYREYAAELAKLGDRRLAVIKKIAETSGKVDEKAVEAGVKESFSIESDRLSLWKKYHGKVVKAIGVVKAARFLQIESQLSKVIDAMIADQVPLLKMPPAPAGEPKK